MIEIIGISSSGKSTLANKNNVGATKFLLDKKSIIINLKIKDIFKIFLIFLKKRKYEKNFLKLLSTINYIKKNKNSLNNYFFDQGPLYYCSYLYVFNFFSVKELKYYARKLISLELKLIYLKIDIETSYQRLKKRETVDFSLNEMDKDDYFKLMSKYQTAYDLIEMLYNQND